VIRFDAEALMPIDPYAAFDLALSIDAHVASFEGSGEQAVGGVTAGLIGLGEFVTWRARHFGITWTMTSTITEWDRPHCFVDEQRKGPFRSFRHEHLFEPVEHGTRLLDHVEFEAPLGVLGRLAERLVLGRYLRHLIDVRNTFLITEATRIAARRGSIDV
jgi:ligand-binding SRPBCC domain-containing protein